MATASTRREGRGGGQFALVPTEGVLERLAARAGLAAILALLHNAADAVSAGGRVRVTARVASGKFGWRGLSWQPSFCEVIVADDGRGIQTADLERIFEPFFTTKGKDGSGLGLSAALRVLQKHGGSIEAFSDGPGRGARFTLMLPRATGSER